MYMMAKHIHLTAVALSILLFITRFVWSEFNADILQKKWAKILPHVIDTILLVSAITLCVILSQYPLVTTWVTVKLLGVIAYIILGLFALKKASTKMGKWLCFAGALAVLGVTAKIAILKQVPFIS